MMMSDLFFQMGFVNFAQRTMFEAMESNTPDFTSRPVKMDAREMGRRLESSKRQSTRTDWR